MGELNSKNLIRIQNCKIENSKSTVIDSFSWKMQSGEAWLVTGPNGGGKAEFLKALSGQLKIIPNQDGGIYSNTFSQSAEIVSLERAAALIEEERRNDESEYIEGGVDHGRTGRVFLCEAISGMKFKRDLSGKTALPEFASKLESYPEVKLCGIEKILDRGLKYMSTGEIRRTLLCRALLSKKQLLILSDPFAGLDAESRRILLSFFDSIAGRQLNADGVSDFPRIILGMERFYEIPDAVNMVLEFSERRLSFCGARSEYEALLAKRGAAKEETREAEKSAFVSEIGFINKETAALQNAANSPKDGGIDEAGSRAPLVEMHGVNVGWDDHRVLANLNWTLRKNEHWLIQGPNGSGKTTFLELITGDNMQVFSNDVRIFGARRGSGETIWDIKRRLGIVSYRLHVEYRMVGASLLDVLVSGFKDSIGLYEKASDSEIAAARKWLALGGFSGSEGKGFNSLSYGEQRAILILRAVVKAPEILILDEPCHGLDEKFRQKILDLLETVAASGTTTLLHVTHDPTEALECEKHILEFHPNEDPMYKIICKN